MDCCSLVNSPKFIKFYRLMCRMTGLTLVLFDSSNDRRTLLDYKVKPWGICEYLGTNFKFRQQCLNCDALNSNKAAKEKKGRYYLCHAGLYDVVVPIFIGSNHVGTFMGGQVLPEPPDEKNFSAFLEKVSSYNYDSQILRELYFKTPSMTKEQFEPVFELIQMFSEHFYELGSRLFEKSTGNADYDAVKEYIDHNFTRNPSLDEVAEKAGLSPNYFCKWFKDNNGLGYVEYKHQLCLEKAVRLLINTDHDISSIAYESGFTSITTFNRIFRQHYDCSPREYRNIK